MPRDKQFLFLKNKTTSEEKFNKIRLFPQKEKDDQEIPKIPKSFHQERLKTAYRIFNIEQRRRVQSRTIQQLTHIDIIKIHFLTRFNLDLQKKFYKKYGISVLDYEDFNKTVLFSIDDKDGFKEFGKHVVEFFESKPDKSYEGKSYSLIALIQDFYFLSSRERLHSFNPVLSSFSLIPFADRRANEIYSELLTYLKEKQKSFIIPNEEFKSNIEISNLSHQEFIEILNNFDIIRLVTSSRSGRIRPGSFGDVIREYGFKVLPNDENVTVAIIDTGVNQIDPLKPVLTGPAFDITSTNAPFWDENGHGTMVAGLVALGSEFLQSSKEEYDSKANIAVIKVLQQGNDVFSINRLIDTIIDVVVNHKIRFFTLSLNDPIPKKYNSPFSDYAYLLDKIAHKYNILIFISTGNILGDRIQELLDEPHASHEYPFHFYCLGKESQIHSCQSTNICAPAESLNNITIGALADNFNNNYGEGITPAKEYPAYYTRKFHFDYAQHVNGTDLSKFQKNKFLNKPDLVYNGGDLFEKDAGIEVLTSPTAQYDKYFSRNAGTSLATPLVASMAAEIARLYPKLHVQTIKALLLNSAELPCGKDPYSFRDASLRGLLKKLTGMGMPNSDYLLLTSENEITFVIEDNIDLEEIKAIDIKLPADITQNKNKLRFTATLCYSFEPLRENHLNYCPLQIVFGFFKPSTPKQLGNDKTENYLLKRGLSWSEDTWAVESRLYSNVQHLYFHLNAENIESVNNTITLGFKCTGKKEIDAEHRSLLESGSHKFSLVINIAEVPEAKASGNLYNEMIALNTIENITILDLDVDLDADSANN